MAGQFFNLNTKYKHVNEIVTFVFILNCYKVYFITQGFLTIRLPELNLSCCTNHCSCDIDGLNEVSKVTILQVTTFGI